jgi:hypothetical protein
LSEIVDLAHLLDAAVSGAESRFEARQRLGLEVPLMSLMGPPEEREEMSPERLAAAYAFGYHVDERNEAGRRRVQISSHFRGPSGEQLPPAVEGVPEHLVEIWAQLAELSTEPFVLARLHHVLFERRHGSVRDNARRATQAYVDCAARWMRDIDSADDLRVALRLSRAIKDDEVRTDVISTMIAAAEDALSSGERIPGVTLRLLEPLLQERGPEQAIGELLLRAWETYPDPWIRDHVAEMQEARATDPGEQARLQEARVQLWLDAADTTEGLIRAGHLKTALERAEATGRSDLVRKAAAALQTIDRDQLGLASFSASIRQHDEQIETLLAPMTKSDSWQEGLAVFARFGPVSGQEERNREQVAENAKQFVLSQILPRELLGGDGLPRFHAVSDEERLEMELASLESQYMQSWAPLLAEALDGIRRRHGITSHADLTAFFADQPMVGEELAAAVARTLHRYWLADYEGAAFTAALRIESLVRRLVLAVGAGVYRLQRANRPGQYPGLGALLEVLRDHGLDGDWYRFLWTLCANPAGLNIRNEIGHGFVENASPGLSALLIQAVLYLGTLAPRETEAESNDVSSDAGREQPATE